jgi:flavin-dependent dehydrogenase
MTLSSLLRCCGLWLQVDVLILGAGPTGLGAATRLQQHGTASYLLVDAVRPLIVELT